MGMQHPFYLELAHEHVVQLDDVWHHVLAEELHLGKREPGVGIELVLPEQGPTLGLRPFELAELAKGRDQNE